MASKEEIYNGLIDNIPEGEGFFNDVIAYEAMEVYAKRQNEILMHNLVIHFQSVLRSMSNGGVYYYTPRPWYQDRFNEIMKEIHSYTQSIKK